MELRLGCTGRQLMPYGLVVSQKLLRLTPDSLRGMHLMLNQCETKPFDLELLKYFILIENAEMKQSVTSQQTVF